MRKIGKTIVSAVLSACLLLLASVASYGGEPIKFTRDVHGRILLPVTYSDGQTFDYMLNTSLRRIGVRQHTAKIKGLALYMRRKSSNFTPLGMVVLPLARYDDMSFDGRLLSERFGGVYPANSTAAGMLGYDAFGNHVVHIQLESSTVSFLANSGMFSTDDWHLLIGRPNRHGGIVLKVEHEGVPLDVLLDTSLSQSVLDRKAAKALGLNPGKSRKKTKFIDVSIGILFNDKTWPWAKIENLAFEGWPIGDVQVGVSTLPVAEATGRKDANLLILGADVLLKQDIAFDFRNHQVWVPR